MDPEATKKRRTESFLYGGKRYLPNGTYGGVRGENKSPLLDRCDKLANLREKAHCALRPAFYIGSGSVTETVLSMLSFFQHGRDTG